MKFFGLIAVICMALALAACGGDDSSAQPENPGTKAVWPEPPAGPPPTKLVIKELEEGTGPAAKTGDEVTVYYIGVDQDGERRWFAWTGPGVTLELGASWYFEGWDEGVEGMKVGGLREVHFPALMTGEPLYYVVKLLKIK